jgi:hypothetical protein
MSIERRIERAERVIGIEGERAIVPTITVVFDYGDDDAVPHFPEPVEEWVTRRRAKEEAERTSLPCIFFANPWSEYEARQRLEAGTLAKHELCGKVPFAELLAAATGRMADQGEQPCTMD